MHASFVYFHFPSDYFYTYAEDPQPRLFKSIAELENKRGFLIAPFTASQTSPYLLIDLEKAEKRSLPDKKEKTKASEHTAWQIDEGCGFLENQLAAQAEYHVSFCKAMQTLKSGCCQKLVLSHTVARKLSHNPLEEAEKLFLECLAVFPHRYVALWHTPHSGTWLTATPELLLEGSAPHWHTMALASTRKISDAEPWNNKDRQEHNIVVQHIRKCLAPHARTLEQAPLCELKAGNVKHLLTKFRFSNLPNFSLTALLASLHPTPAICGTPSERALALIPTIEPHQREYYAGYSGLLGSTACRLYVTLRCAKLQRHQATLYAGGGLLAESEERLEWEEIQQKFRSIEHCLRGFF